MTTATPTRVTDGVAPLLSDRLPGEPGAGRSPRRAPAVVQALLAAAGVLALALALLAAPGNDLGSRSGGVAIGERELVRITGPDGRSIETLATIDTGASRSAIDRALADELGLDLENADTVTVGSALGREKRPLVDVDVQLGGRATSTSVTVSDRSRLDTRALIGRSDLAGYSVTVGQSVLTEPGAATMPSALETALTQTPVYGPSALLALVPLGAAVIVLLRVVLGVSSLGTFSPVLLALGYVQSGVLVGVAMTAVVLAAGLAAQPLLRRFRLPRVARLGVLVGVVTSTLLGIELLAGLDAGAWGAALPVVVSAVVVERMWETWDLEGAPTALKDGAGTLAIAAVVTVLMLSPVVRMLAESAPLALALAGLLCAGLAGSYRGLRLVELARFRAVAQAGQGER